MKSNPNNGNSTAVGTKEGGPPAFKEDSPPVFKDAVASTQMDAPGRAAAPDAGVVAAGPKDADEQERAGGAAEGRARELFTRLFIVLFYTGIALGVAVILGGKALVARYLPYIAAGVAAMLVVAALPSTRRWFAKTTAQRRIAAVIFGLVPVILFFFVGVFLAPAYHRTPLLRMIFLVAVCSLPAIMYYLFIATKKYSLLNEFLMNLGRLGLLDQNRVPEELRCAGLKDETESERRNRIRAYVQKFESVYGAVPTDLGGLVLEPTDLGRSTIDPRVSKTDSSGLANIFTLDTTIPVILATILIALGWLVTLPPWPADRPLIQPAALAEAAPAESPAPADQAPAPEGRPFADADSAAAPDEKKALPASEETGNKAWVAVFTPELSPVRFAFIGAYFFSLQLLFRRYVRRDMRASAYVAVSLRIILAMIGIWVVEEAVKLGGVGSGAELTGPHRQQALIVLGFVIGVFPRVAWQVVQAVIKRVCSIALPNLRTQLPISDLDGLTVWHEARFEEEDIENIPNMATADLVDLMINTRIPPDRIIDWVDQAILYTHLGPETEGEDARGRRAVLRAHGIRTATTLVEAYDRSRKHGDRDDFEQLLPNGGRKIIRSLVDAVGTNPNLKLIQTWRGLPPHEYASAHDRDAPPAGGANPLGP